MENLKKIDGLDRYLLIATTLIFGDIPQIVLTFVFFPAGWIYGIISALIAGFILNMVFNIHIFGPRMGMKAIVLFLPELIPGIGALSFLSVAMFVITHFHNKHVEEAENEA